MKIPFELLQSLMKIVTGANIEKIITLKQIWPWKFLGKKLHTLTCE